MYSSPWLFNLCIIQCTKSLSHVVPALFINHTVCKRVQEWHDSPLWALAALWKYSSSCSQPVALYKDEWLISHPSCFMSDIHLITNWMDPRAHTVMVVKRKSAPFWESSPASSLVTREIEPSTPWHNTYWYQIWWFSKNIVFVITLHYTAIYKKKKSDSLWLFLPTLNVQWLQFYNKTCTVSDLTVWHPIVFLMWNLHCKCAQMKPIQNLILEKALSSAPKNLPNKISNGTAWMYVACDRADHKWIQSR